MRHRLGALADFTDGQIAIVQVDGRSIGVFRRGESFYGLLNLCPHRAAPVCLGVVTGTMLPSAPDEYRYGLDGLVLRCPWHGWEFDLRTGESIGPVDKRHLTMYPVVVEDDDVYLETEARHRDAGEPPQAGARR